MSEQFRSWAAISFLLVSVSSSVCAQRASGTRKDCVPPRVTYSPEPSPSHYPRRDSANAAVDILIDEKGHVLDPKIVTSSGIDDFDHDAMVTVRRWRFKPSSCNGKPMPVHVIVQIKSTVMH
jgi:TonB family protein